MYERNEKESIQLVYIQGVSGQDGASTHYFQQIIDTIDDSSVPRKLLIASSFFPNA